MASASKHVEGSPSPPLVGFFQKNFMAILFSLFDTKKKEYRGKSRQRKKERLANTYLPKEEEEVKEKEKRNFFLGKEMK